MRSNSAFNSFPVKGKDREDKRIAYRIALFHGIVVAYFSWKTICALPVCLHSSLGLALGICMIVDCMLSFSYLYVFLTKSRGAFGGLNALMMAEITTYSQMIHGGSRADVLNWISFVIPIGMILALPYFWKEKDI